jgi:hypothetical protein
MTVSITTAGGTKTRFRPGSPCIIRGPEAAAREKAPEKTPFENKAAKQKSKPHARNALFPQISRCLASEVGVDYCFLEFAKTFCARAKVKIREEPRVIRAK